MYGFVTSVASASLTSRYLPLVCSSRSRYASHATASVSSQFLNGASVGVKTSFGTTNSGLPPDAVVRPMSTSAPAMALGKAVVAGGTGFIGSRLVRTLVDRGVDVTVLTRSSLSARKLPAGAKARVWAPDRLAAVGDDWLGWERVLEGADLVVNLCGQPIVTRWTEASKKNIIDSRIKPTNALTEAILKLPVEQRPKCVVSTSGVGHYGVSDSARFTEESSVGNDFLADLTSKWEGATQPMADAGVRVVIIRTGVVLGNGGGALARMLPAFQMFLGGPVGTGRQWVSWIHVDDLVGMYIKAAEDPTVSGVYNGTAPEPVHMGEMCAALARALNRPNLFPVPEIALKLLFGEGADVVLTGQHVAPKRWLAQGFEYKHPTIDSAMRAVASEC